MPCNWLNKLRDALSAIMDIAAAVRDVSALELRRKDEQQRLQFILEESGKVEQRIAENIEKLNDVMYRLELANTAAKGCE